VCIKFVYKHTLKPLGLFLLFVSLNIQDEIITVFKYSYKTTLRQCLIIGVNI
jgi:hypothetical protein